MPRMYSVIVDGHLCAAGATPEEALEAAKQDYVEDLPSGSEAVSITMELASAITAGVDDHWIVAPDGSLDVDIDYLILRLDLAANLADLVDSLKLLETCGLDCEFDIDLEELPAFGGVRPEGEGVLSWDPHRVLLLKPGTSETFLVVTR